MGGAFSAIALRVIRNPAVANMPFREDGQCDVNAEFQESLGEPLWNTASARKAKRTLAVTTRQVDGAVENVATAKHVKFVGAANAVADEHAKKVAELLGMLGCCDVIRRLILPVAVHQHRRHCARD